MIFRKFNLMFRDLISVRWASTPHRFRLPSKQMIHAFVSMLVLISLLSNVQSSVKASSPGSDGAVTIATANTIVNRYTSLATNAAAGSTSLTVTSAAALNVAPGDLILIIQMQGANIDTSVNTAAWGAITNYNNAGNYEFATVYSVSGNIITLSPCGPFLQRSYTATGHVQVIRVPQYTTLTINAGASIVAPAWNGTTGGIAAMVAQTTVTVNGSINVSGKGFRGGIQDNNTTAPVANLPGYAYTTDTSGAQKGESIAGFTGDYNALATTPGAYGRGAPANGGGGGNAHNAGGGGGANGYSGIAWNGQGNPDNSNAGWTTAWNIDGTLTSATTSSGGGRGGYTFAFNNSNALTTPPGNAAWVGDNRQERGGLGGRPLINLPVGSNTSNRIFFGGGGGAGDGNNTASADGAAGGGIVFVLAPTVTGTGTINASGQNAPNTIPGHNDAPGGGGGGGSVIVGATTLSSVSINANGGKGGNQLIANDEAEGPGGGGSGGVVATSGGFVPIVVNGGANGQTSSTALTEFLPNGSTSGGAGNTSTIIPSIPNQPCIGIAKTVTNVAVVAGPAYDVTMVVRAVNMGSEQLTNVQATDNLFAVFGASYSILAAPVVTFSTGGGTIAGNAAFNGNANTNLLTPGTLNIGSTALITFTVHVTAAGSYNNVANGTGTGLVTATIANDASQNGINPDPDGDGNPGNNSLPTPIILPPVTPTVAKAFAPNPVSVGGASTLTITLTNPSGAALTAATLTDNLPSGLTTVVATAATTCGGTASQTSTSVSLSGGTIPAAGNCTLSVQVTGVGGGAYLNTIPAGALTTSGGVNTVAATSILNVNNAPVTVAKSFNPVSIPVGGVSQLTIVITNPNAAAVALTNPNALTDTYPAGVTNAAVPAGATTCGGTVTAVAGTGSVVLTGAGNSVPANGSCTITVNVTSTTPGPAVTNTIAANAVQTVTAGLSNVNPATATLVVSSLPPDLVKSFAPTTIAVGATSTLTFTITNPNTTALNNISFVDVFPAGLTAVNGNATVCGGPANNRVISGTNTITVTGGVLAGGANCTFNVTVTGATSGVKNNTTGAVSSTETGVGPTSNTATLLVAAADLGITKTDSVAAVNAGGTTTYTIVVTNAGPSAANNAIFTDPVVAGLTKTGVTCGTATGGAACPAVGVTTVALMQGAGIVIPTLPSGGSVTFTVTANVTAVGGTVANTANVATPVGTSDPLAGNNTATDTDTVTPIANLSVTKTDGVVTINEGGTTTYTILVANAGPSAANNAVFTDPVVAGLTVTGVTCGTATGGAACPAVGVTTVALMQGAGIVIPTLPSGGSVTFTVTATVTAVSGSTVTNTANVATPAGTTDPTPANNTASDADTVTPSANLSITKTDGVTNVNGGATTYTIVVANAGPSAANNAIFTDPVAAGLTATSVTCGTATGGAACPAVGVTTVALMQGAGIVIPTLPNGGSVTFTVTANVTAVGGNVTNTANVATPAGTIDPTPANNTATDTDTATALAVTKTSSAGGTVNPGATITYTVTMTNNGTGTLNNIVVNDALPTGTTYVAQSTLATMTSPAATLTYLDQFEVRAYNNSNGTAAWGTSWTEGGEELADNPGNSATAGYIQVTNNGVANDELSFDPAAAVGYLANSQYTLQRVADLTGATSANLSFTWDEDGTLEAAPDDTVSVDVCNGALCQNFLTRTGARAPLGPINVTNQAIGAAYIGANTTIRITVTGFSGGFENFAVDDLQIQYTAPASLIKDNVPAGTNADLTSGVPATLVTAADNFDIPAGQTLTVTYRVVVDNPVTGGLTQIINTAAATSVEITTPVQSIVTDNITNPSADLAITKTDSVAAVNAGGTTTYTVRVTNNGPSSVTGAILSDPAVAGLTKTGVVCSATPGQCTAPTTPTIVQLEGGAFTLPALTSGQFYEITIPANVIALSGTVTNNATIAAPVGTIDPTPGNNTGTDTDNVTPVADLSVTKTDSVGSVNANGTTTYTVRVTNNGPSSVTGAILSDPTVAGLTKTAVACSAAPGQCTAPTTPTVAQLEGGAFALPVLTSGQSYEITITANVTALSGSVTNTATIAEPVGTTDPIPANNTGTDTDNVTPVADLSITKTDGVGSVNANGTTTYTVRVTNNGPSSVTGAILSDPAMAGLSKTAVTCSATPGQCTAPTTPTVAQLEGSAFALPAQTSGQFYEITITANVTALSGSVTNTATIAVPVGTTDPTPGNNSTSDTDTVTPVADVSVTKTDGSVTYIPGGVVTYTITVTNNGPSDVAGVTIDDTRLAPITTWAWTCTSQNGGASGCTPAASSANNFSDTIDLPNGGSVVYTATANTDPAATGNLVNVATVTVPGGTIDPTPGNNSSTDTDNPAPSANLSLTKIASTTTPLVGANLTFTLTVTNNGPSDATGVVITDLLPAGLTYVSDNGGGAYVSGTGLWTIGNLNSGANASLQITVQVTTASAVSNYAEISASNQPDPNSTPNNGSITEDDDDTVNLTPAPANLTISKIHAGNFTRGGTGTYTITVGNAVGAGSTLGTVTVSDTLPTGLTLASTPTGTGWACIGAVGTSSFTCTRSDVLAGGASYPDITVIVDVDLTTANNVTNTATASGGGDPTPANGSDPTTVVNPALPTATDDSTTTPLNTPATLPNITANDTANGTGNSIVIGTIDLDPSTAGQQTTFTDASGNTWTVNTTTGAVLFTPANNFVGTATIPYSVQDELGQSATANLNVTVTTPASPTATDDSTTTAFNTPATLPNITANDTANGAGNTIVISTIDLDPSTAGQQTTFTDASGNTWTVNTTTGAVLFTPANNFTGVATIPYTVQDELGQSATANLNVTVTIPAPPVATDDSTTTTLNTPVTLPNIAANDTANGTGNSIVIGTIDLDPGTPGQQTTFTDVDGNTWTVNTTTGAVLFTPANNFVGTATIPYTVQDELGQSATANLNITVTTPAPPTSTDDSTTTTLNTPVTLPNITANDTANGTGNSIVIGTIDLDPSTLGQQITFTDASGNTWTVNTTTGAVLFTPTNNFIGLATTPYTVQDELGQSAIANLNVTVTTPAPPTATDDSTTTPFNTPATLPNITGNDTANGIGNSIVIGTIDLDPGTPGQQTTFTDVNGNTWSVNTTTGDVTFTPTNNFTGLATIPYTVQDELGQNTTANLNVTVTTPVSPTAVDDSTTTPLNTPATLPNITSNDTANGAGNSIVISTIDLDPSTAGQQTTLTDASGNTWTVNTTTGAVLFTSANNFTGLATIPYTVQDELGQSATANLNVTVTTPAPPTATDDSTTTAFNTPATLPNIIANDTANGTGNSIVISTIDLDPSTAGQQTTFTDVDGNTWIVNTTTGDVTFTPVTNYTGTATIPYAVQDALGQIATANLSVAVNMPPVPVATDDSTTTPFNTPATLPNITANDTANGTGNSIVIGTIDLDPGTPGQQTTFTDVDGNTWSVNTTTGDVTFTPAATFNGVATIPYIVQDSLGQPATANLQVTVGNPGTVNGVIYNDQDANGVKSATENGIGGVKVDLYDSTGTILIATTTTLANGSYSFNVPPGDYIVFETDPAGYVSSTPNNIPVTVSAGGSTTVNFGDYQLSNTALSSIVGTVFDDVNSNGTQDPGETALSGVTVQLKNNVGTVIATTTTGASGGYSFANLPAGTYTVTEIDPAGYISTTLNNVTVPLTTGTTATVNFGDQTSGVATIADPAVTKLGSPTNATVGSTVIYTITVGNNGTANATNVVLTDTKPAFLDIIAITISPNPGLTAVITGNTFTINFGTVTPTDFYSVTVLTRVNSLGQPPGGSNNVSITTNSVTDRIFNNSASAALQIPSDSNNNSGGTLKALLPNTGFAPGVVTDLSNAPRVEYTNAGDVVLEIPSLGIKIPVVGIPKKNGTWDVTWLSKQAGWLEGTAFPSWSGNSVLTSHVYLANGLPGPFVDLNKLKFGDKIVIHAYGQKYIFEVQTNQVVEPKDTSAFKHEEKSWLTLTTCKEFDEKTNTYKKRVVVRALLVNVEVDK